MINDRFIRIGDKVDLRVREEDFCAVTVSDITRGGVILVSEPSLRGMVYPLHTGDEVSLYFYRESGRFAFDVKVCGYTTSNDVRFVELEQLTEPRKEQRREFYRLPAYLKTLVCQYTDSPDLLSGKKDEGGDTEEIAYTNDISIAGISLRTKQMYTIGETLELRIHLGWPNDKAPPLVVLAEVRRVIRLQDRVGYQVGFRFIDLSRVAHDSITKFVIHQQQKRIRQRKLVEGD